MKKRALFLLIVLAFFVLAFSAEAKEVLSIGTAPAGGAWYGIGGALADVITKSEKGITAIAEVTGGAIENVKLIGTKKIDIGFTINAIAKAGYDGKVPFKEAYPNIQTLASSVQKGYLQIVTLKGSGLKYVSDLKGQRVAVGPQGHGSLIRLKEVFKVLGFGFGFDQIKPVFLPYSQSMTTLGDRRVDAAVMYVAPPAPAIKTFGINHDIDLLSLKEENRKAILKQYSHYLSVEIPAGTYKGVDVPIPTVATANVIIVDAGVDEALVYEITKAIFENIDKIRAGHPSAKKFGLDVATKGSAVPFHPGAIKYYKEKGVWTGN